MPNHRKGNTAYQDTRREDGGSWDHISYMCVCLCVHVHINIHTYIYYIHIYVSISISDRTDAAVSGFRERARQTSHLRHGKTVTCNSVPLASLMSPSQLGGKNSLVGAGCEAGCVKTFVCARHKDIYATLWACLLLHWHTKMISSYHIFSTMHGWTVWCRTAWFRMTHGSIVWCTAA